MIRNILLVAFGGSVGSVARYLCQKWFAGNYVYTFPWATFFVNIAGCFLLGVIYAIAERSSVLTPQVRLLLVTGFCGGFTTFSTFAFENMSLLRSGDIMYFLIYSIASVVLGIVAVFGGVALFKYL